MAIGIGALESTISRIKKKLPAEKSTVSVVFFDSETGEIDWPPEDQINKRGVLLAPKPVTMEEWET